MAELRFAVYAVAEKQNYVGDVTHAGYREIQNPPERYEITDLLELSSLWL